MRFFVVWCEYLPADRAIADHFEVFESESEARAKYDALRELPNLHSASILTRVLASTDYPTG